jgi:hypothetical protein
MHRLFLLSGVLPHRRHEGREVGNRSVSGQIRPGAKKEALTLQRFKFSFWY